MAKKRKHEPDPTLKSWRYLVPSPDIIMGWLQSSLRRAERELKAEGVRLVPGHFDGSDTLRDIRTIGQQMLYASASALLGEHQPFTEREIDLITMAFNAGHGYSLRLHHKGIETRMLQRLSKEQANEKLRQRGKKPDIVRAVATEIAKDRDRSLDSVIFPEVADAFVKVDGTPYKATTVHDYWYRTPVKTQRELIKAAEAKLQKGG